MKYAVKELNKSFFVLAIIGHTHLLHKLHDSLKYNAGQVT